MTKKRTRKPVARKKIGRPTKRTPELIDAMCEWIASGKTLLSFCRKNGITSATIYSWRDSDHTLSKRLAHAREMCSETLEDEIQDIADNREFGDDDVSHRKLRIYAREKRLVWNNPGRYGQKTQIGGAADLPPLQLSDSERIARMQALLETARKRRLQETNDGEDSSSQGDGSE